MRVVMIHAVAAPADDQLICYSAEHGAQAIGLACSVYTPMVEMVRGGGCACHLVLWSVMAEAVQAGHRIGLIAAVPATLRDAEHFLQQVHVSLGHRWTRIHGWRKISWLSSAMQAKLHIAAGCRRD